VSDGDRILHRIIDRQLAKGEFTAGGAAEKAFKPIAKLDGITPLDIPHLSPYVILGLQQKAKQYRPADSVSEDDESGQGDFSRLSSDFYRLINIPAAMDECEGAIRMPPAKMNLVMLRQHIALKRKKAHETWKNADLLDRFITRHQEYWEANPELLLEDILGDIGRRDAAD
jgi:hypothetical protein